MKPELPSPSSYASSISGVGPDVSIPWGGKILVFDPPIIDNCCEVSRPCGLDD